MTDNNQDLKVVPFYARHLFGVMVAASITIAVALVFISMGLYYSSGASQLDLSSPSYVDVRNQVDNSDDFSEYSNTGKMNASAVSNFKSLFNQKVEKIKSVDIFGGDPLSPESLGMVVAAEATTGE